MHRETFQRPGLSTGAGNQTSTNPGQLRLAGKGKLLRQEDNMKTKYTIALSMLAGMAVGAVAVQTLHAQAKPPVYMVALNEVANGDRYAKDYVPPAQASVKAHGGVYVAAGPGTVIEGDLPKGPVVILRWDSLKALKAWKDSPDFVAAHEIGMKYAKFNIVAVSGVTQ
jgi:uncharacterized protein (DUF1330 family)